jgi:hypothetical protein
MGGQTSLLLYILSLSGLPLRLVCSETAWSGGDIAVRYLRAGYQAGVRMEQEKERD